MIDELIGEAAGRRKLLLEQIKTLSHKIEEEIREVGIPMVLPSFPNSNCNLPKQLKIAEIIFEELEGMKDFMGQEKEKIYKNCHEMYREELESSDPDGLPNWIHELFTAADSSDSSFSSFTSTTTAIDQLDPFISSLSGSLARLEEAHQILTARLEIFRAEFEVLWREIEESFGKLYPFDETEITGEVAACKVVDVLINGSEKGAASVTRSSLRKVSLEWKRIEKDRSESISGSILLIGRLWNLLETPQEERFQLSSANLSLQNIQLLSQERNRLINFQQQKFKELYDAQVQELRKMMTALAWSQGKQDSLLSSCQSYTADGLQFLSIQLATLQPKLELSLEIINSITSRYNLISKMREFEKSASDPARLFRSSFQLLQEEKFRKTALPNLLNLESHIRSLLSDFDSKFAEEFAYHPADSEEGEGSAYVHVMEEEISSRFMSSGIFGFDQSKQRKERQSSIPTSSTPRYTAAAAAASSTIRKQSGTTSPPATINANVIPQRRKLDK